MAAQRQAKPIIIEMLRLLAKPQRHLDPVRDLRDLASGGVCGRVSEIGAGEAQAREPGVRHSGVTVTLERSKTDQQGKGSVVTLPQGPARMCPVKLLRTWIQLMRGLVTEDIGASPLFRRVDRYGKPGSGLSGAAIGGVIQRRMRDCRLNPSGFSAHSLRSGLVTAAAKAGVPTWAIQRQTGHRSESTVHRYIRGCIQVDHGLNIRLLVVRFRLADIFLSQTNRSQLKIPCINGFARKDDSIGIAESHKVLFLRVPNGIHQTAFQLQWKTNLCKVFTSLSFIVYSHLLPRALCSESPQQSHKILRLTISGDPSGIRRHAQ